LTTGAGFNALVAVPLPGCVTITILFAAAGVTVTVIGEPLTLLPPTVTDTAPVYVAAVVGGVYV
jgi:hypothetical protein